MVRWRSCRGRRAHQRPEILPAVRRLRQALFWRVAHCCPSGRSASSGVAEGPAALGGRLLRKSYISI